MEYTINERTGGKLRAEEGNRNCINETTCQVRKEIDEKLSTRACPRTVHWCAGVCGAWWPLYVCSAGQQGVRLVAGCPTGGGDETLEAPFIDPAAAATVQLRVVIGVV